MAPPTSSRLEAIRAQLIVELKKIKTANGYLSNIDDLAVSSRPNEWRNYSFDLLPGVLLLLDSGSREIQKPRGSRTKRYMKLLFRLDCREVEGFVQIARLESDLQYLLLQNIPLNNGTNDLVVQIKMLDDRTTQGVFDPIEIWTVTVEVIYHANY